MNLFGASNSTVSIVMMTMTMMMTGTEVEACSMAFQNNCTEVGVKQSIAHDKPNSPVCEVTEYPIIGRTMDWQFAFNDTMLKIPRGISMDGGVPERTWKCPENSFYGLATTKDGQPTNAARQGKKVCPEDQENELACSPRCLDASMEEQMVPNPITWTSKYGSVQAALSPYMAMYGYDREMDGAADGMNEAGFSAHMLYLGATVYPQRDTGGKPNLSYLRWARYLIDTCATVEDAIEAMKNVNIVEVGGGFRKYTLDGKGKLKKLGAHVAVQDKTGDAAIFELGKDGVLTICHEGKVNPDGKYPNFNKCRIMTNDPPLAQQYEYMSRFTVNGNSENGYPLPGTTAPNDRFTRAHFFNDHLTLPKNSDYVAEDFASKVRSLMNNIVVPVDSPPIFPTWYMTVSDLFSGSGIEEFDPKKPELCGDQTCQFVNGGADCSECGMLPRPPSPTSPPRPPTASPTSYYTSAPTKIKSCKK